MMLYNVFRAEVLKLKRTLALVLTLVTPLVIVLLQLLVILRTKNTVPLTWKDFILQTSTFWAILMLPLFVTLETALLAMLEHQNKMFKQLFALPVRRGAVYAAKLAGGMILAGVSILSLYLETIAAGGIIWLIRPEAAPRGDFPWILLLQAAGLLFACTWLLTALHSFVALYWPSFVVAATTGVIGTISGFVVINSESWSKYYPWSIPAIFLVQYVKGVWLWPAFLTAIPGGLAAAVIGGWLFSRREVA